MLDTNSRPSIVSHSENAVEHDGLVEKARTILVERYGSMWEAANAMRVGISGGQLLIAMRRELVDPGIAALVEIHTGVSLPCVKVTPTVVPLRDLGTPIKRKGRKSRA
jgi:hypothetical protein